MYFFSFKDELRDLCKENSEEYKSQDSLLSSKKFNLNEGKKLSFSYPIKKNEKIHCFKR